MRYLRWINSFFKPFLSLKIGIGGDGSNKNSNDKMHNSSEDVSKYLSGSSSKNKLSSSGEIKKHKSKVTIRVIISLYNLHVSCLFRLNEFGMTHIL